MTQYFRNYGWPCPEYASLIHRLHRTTKIGLKQCFMSFRRLFPNQKNPGLYQPRHLNQELLERQLLLPCDIQVTGGLITITCGAEDDTDRFRIDTDGTTTST